MRSRSATTPGTSARRWCSSSARRAWSGRRIFRRARRAAARPWSTPRTASARWSSTRIGRVFMTPFDDPFAVLNRELEACPLGEAADAIVVDFHCEASSEKQGIGFFCDGRASLVVGTHTHVPTSDHQILAGGTAYMTDAGMTGDYDSIIGMQKEEPLRALYDRHSLGTVRTGCRRRHAERRRGRDRRRDRPRAADRAGADRRQAGADAAGILGDSLNARSPWLSRSCAGRSMACGCVRSGR